MVGRDTIEFRKPFQFDAEVAGVFDDMLKRSIPDYRSMRELTDAIGAKFAGGRPDRVLAIGSSLGRDFDTFAMTGCEIVSCEVSAPMVEEQRRRFKDFKNVDIRQVDITKDFPGGEFDLALSVLTLQFIRPELREKVCANVYAHLKDGGALLLVEKVLGESYEIEDLMVEQYMREKGANGYTEKQLASKSEALAFVMQPYKASQNEAMLRSAGFSKIDCYWRHLNFAAFVAVK